MTLDMNHFYTKGKWWTIINNDMSWRINNLGVK